MKRVSSLVLAAVMAMGIVAQPLAASAAAVSEPNANDGYEIYPVPQSITYQTGDFILKDKVNVIYEEGIDAATKARVQEVLDLKNLTVSGNTVVSGQTNILVGTVNNTDTKVDDYIAEKKLSDDALFEKTDSYILSSDNGTFAILGKDNDSSFYGVTTLYHVINQLESRTVRNFLVKDYADVVSRGFIEGYYGEPWSTEDRINLMKWGGYYKLNSYFYAPKDDPKHNAQWRSLYTEKEIEEKIKPLAEAGNNSKCRFVFALHPYMNSPIRYDTEANYQADLKTMQAKFEQVIKAGVRQIAILADDAGKKTPEQYRRTLEDMTKWLQEMQKTYPDLKMTLPFCAQEYMYGGETYFSTFPENVQVIMTGGRIWGEVNDSFTQGFTDKTGRGPYLWINWPCSDNSKNHLIMGGYTTFLHSGVNPANVQGIVLNPMQQSEPSKVAIFGNACYSWNIWQSDAEANQAWHDSFKYVNHGSAIETPASTALRELSKHMINQAMDGRVTPLQESVDLNPILEAFKTKMKAGTLTAEDVDKVITEFETLQEAAKTFRAEGNKQLMGNQKDYAGKGANEQMAPWLDCWDDTTEAVLAYLDAVKAVIAETPDYTSALNLYNAGKEAFARSKTHGFSYINHQEYAEVGVQHIVPFIKAVESYLSENLQKEIDPSVVISSYISNVLTKPYAGSVENIFDGNDETVLEFHEPLYIKTNDYFGVQFSKPIAVDSIRIAMGGGKNHFYHGKLQYTKDGEKWEDVNGEVYHRPQNDETPIEVTGLNLTDVVAVRLIATADNGVDAWITIKSFDINRDQEQEETTTQYPVTAEQVEIEGAVMAPGGESKANLVDGDKTTELWLRKSAEGSDRDITPVNAAVVLDLGGVKEVGSVYFAQGSSVAGDVIQQGVVEYSTDKTDWRELGKLNNAQEQTVEARSAVQARYIRIKNTQATAGWWRLGEVKVFNSASEKLTFNVSPVNTAIGRHSAINDGAKNNKYEYIVDGDTNTMAWMANTDNGNIQANAGVQILFNREAKLKDIKIVQDSGDRMNNLIIQYKSGEEWKQLTHVTQNPDAVIECKDVVTDGIRILSGQNASTWWKLKEVIIHEKSTKATDKYVYSNLKNHGFGVILNKDEAEMTTGNVTLKAGDYIGIDQTEIRELNTVEIPADLKGATLEISKNAIEWETVTANDVLGKRVRYVRIINKTDAPVTIDMNQFKITNNVLGTLGELISSDIEVISSWGDDRYNTKAFDQNINTTTKFGGNPRTGNTAVYSLGRPIDIKSIRVYNADTEQDYIRDAEIQLSTDGTNWKTALTIGDGQTDSDRESPFGNITDPAKHTDSNYPNKLYYGNDAVPADVGTGARYLRVRITADYPSRALVMNEIMINENEYQTNEGNKAFEGAQEAPGHAPSLMLDQDLNTTYKPAKANEQITYYLSNVNQTAGLRIVQNGAVSGATVAVGVCDAAPAMQLSQEERVAKSTEIELGKLAQAINEFVVPEGKVLTYVTIRWTDKLPEIAELLFLNSDVAAADNKAALTELVTNTPAEFDSWTKQAQDAYKALQANGQMVLDSEYASKASVATMITTLNTAAKNAEVKANAETIAKLEALQQDKVSNDDYIYSNTTYAAYVAQLAKAEAALKTPENLTQAEADKILAAAQKAKDDLTWSIYQRESAELAIESFETVKAENYSLKSYNDFKAVRDEIAALIAQDKAGTAQDPHLYMEKVTAYQTAYENLWSVAELKTLVEKQLDSNLYTPESFQAYEQSKQAAKDLLAQADATNEQLDAALANLKKAEQDLVLVESVDVQAVIDAMRKENPDNYTEESYKNLMDVVDQAEQDMAKNNPALNAENIQKMRDAQSALVSVVELNVKLEEAAAISAEKYTVSSYKDLQTSVDAANELKKNGTKEAIEQMIQELNSKIAALAPRAEGLDEYRNGITLKDEAKYDPEIYAPYKDAYDKLMGMDPADTSRDAFEAAKAEFEKQNAILDEAGEIPAPTPEPTPVPDTAPAAGYDWYKVLAGINAAGKGSFTANVGSEIAVPHYIWQAIYGKDLTVTLQRGADAFVFNGLDLKATGFNPDVGHNLTDLTSYIGRSYQADKPADAVKPAKPSVDQSGETEKPTETVEPTAEPTPTAEPAAPETAEPTEEPASAQNDDANNGGNNMIMWIVLLLAVVCVCGGFFWWKKHSAQE